MVFNVIHGSDEKDASTVFTPFTFNRNLRLASVRIGYDKDAPKEMVDAIRALGGTPKEIAARPRLQEYGLGSGLNVEYAAAFDFFVQRKAKEIGLDLANLPEPSPRTPGGGGGVYGTLPPEYSSSPMAPANWNPRFVGGRTTRAFEFVNNQRRRMMYVVKYNETFKDVDMFVGSAQSGWDVAPNAQTGNPCAVVPYKFDVPQQGGGGGGAANAAPATPLNPQPICGIIIGALYSDDKLLSVAHQLQKRNNFTNKRPTL